MHFSRHIRSSLFYPGKEFNDHGYHFQIKSRTKITGDFNQDRPTSVPKDVLKVDSLLSQLVQRRLTLSEFATGNLK